MLPPNSLPQPEYDYEPVQPAVWPWFVTYCGLSAFLCFLWVGVALVMLFIDPAILDSPTSTTTTTPMEMKLIGGFYLVFSLPFFLVFAAAPFLPKRPWVWIFDLVLICFSMSSLCCLPIAIPLLIFWLKDETKLFFRKPVPALRYQ